MQSSDARAFHVSEGDIECKEHIGHGILGEMFTAKHKRWGPVWIKELAVNTSITTNAAKKLRKEAEVLKNLRHKNIVQLMGMIWDNLQKKYALVFEPSRFGILAEFLERIPSLDMHLKVAFMYDMALGMSYLHSLQPPVIHRDLRWHLVQVHEHFVLKISDFGLAEWINYSRSHSNNRYHEGPTYHIAPECWRDINLKPSWQTDVYSFAVLCWTIATQEEPYKYLVDAQQIRGAVMDGQRPNLDDLPEACIPELRDWLSQWWTQNPSERTNFQDIAEMLEQYTEQHKASIEAAKLRLYRGDGGAASEDTAGHVSIDGGNESVGEVPSYNINAYAAERISKVNPQDLSGSDFASQVQTTEKRLSATALLEQNDLEEDADESPRNLTNQQPSYAQHSVSSTGTLNSLNTGHSGRLPKDQSQSFLSSTTFGPNGTHPSSFTSIGSLAKSTFPEWKMPDKSTIQSAFPTSVYEKTTEMGQTTIHTFGSVSNVQIGDQNMMTVTTNRQLGTPNRGTSCLPKNKPLPGTKGAKKYKITASKKVLDDKNIDMLKRELGKHWKELARKLNFTDGEIDSIQYDNDRFGLQEIIQQFLRQWKEKMANGASLCALADALIKMKLYTIAEKIDDSK